MAGLPVEIDARLDLDAAARDAEVDRERRAEFERRLDLAYAFGADADREKTAAAEQRNRETERPLSLGEIETDLGGLRVERKQKSRAERECSSAKMPTLNDGMLIE